MLELATLRYLTIFAEGTVTNTSFFIIIKLCAFMYFTGTAVTQNLLKSDYKVTTILDLDKDKCSNYPTCKVATSARQVAEEVDITITGIP